MPFIVIDNPSGVYSNYLKCHCRLGVQKAMSIDNPGQVYRESGGDRTWYLQPLSSTVVCSLSCHYLFHLTFLSPTADLILAAARRCTLHLDCLSHLPTTRRHHRAGCTALLAQGSRGGSRRSCGRGPIPGRAWKLLRGGALSCIRDHIWVIQCRTT